MLVKQSQLKIILLTKKFYFVMKKFKFVVGIFIVFLFLFVMACAKDAADRNVPSESQKAESAYAEIYPNINKILYANFDNTARMIGIFKSQSKLATRTNQTLLDFQIDALTYLAPNIPQYPYNQTLVQSDDLEPTTQEINYTTVLNDPSFPLTEKSYYTNIMNLNAQQNFAGLKNYIINNRIAIQNNNASGLTPDGKDRLLFMFSVVESVIDYHGLGGPVLEPFVACDMKKVAKTAISGAVSMGLQGLYRGCVTGMFLGFNPGSAAAGCMGGFISGVLAGAVIGTATGLYNNC